MEVRENRCETEDNEERRADGQEKERAEKERERRWRTERVRQNHSTAAGWRDRPTVRPGWCCQVSRHLRRPPGGWWGGALRDGQERSAGSSS